MSSHLLHRACVYLEGSSHAEDAVVGFLWGQTLQGELHGFALLRDQIVGPVRVALSAVVLSFPFRFIFHLFLLMQIETYLKPSLRYPALSKYHSDSGFIQRINHGRFWM